MRTRAFLAVFLVTAVILTGCGGGGGGGTPPPPGLKLTRVFTSVAWPERSRVITAVSSALSINIVMKNASENGSDFVWNIDRGSNAAAFTQNYTSTTTAKVGTWDTTVKFYTGAGATGTIIAETTTTVTIAEDGTGFPSLSPASKITRVAVSTNRNVPVGERRTVPFTATDNTGNVVPVSAGSAVWKVTAGQDKLRFVAGQAEGIAPGTASVTATVDGITSEPVQVSIGTENGTLTVNVKDTTGSLIPRATVTLFQSGFQVKQTQTTNGKVTFAALGQGSTEVKVTSAGFHDGQAVAQVVPSPTPVVDVTLTPAGAPIATTLDTRLISTSGNMATFETDIAVTNDLGQSITSLSPASFIIDPIAIGGSAFTFQQEAAAQVDADPRANFSAFLAADATESMRGSDPTNSRGQGMKEFFRFMPVGSNAAFGYFPGTTATTTLRNFPTIGFVRDGTPYYPIIDDLKNLTMAGTPLHSATIQAIDIAAAVNSNANKAVVLLTDGHNTAPGATLAQAISAGKSKNVRVFTVSIGLQTYQHEMAQLAEQTGGGTAIATNSTQLTTFYKSLSALLKGQVKVYRVRWTATRDAGPFPAGAAFYGTVKIPQSEGVLLAPFYVPVS